MNYYKIYTNDAFIGIVCSNEYVTYQPQNNTLSLSNDQVGQFVEYKGKLYRDTWMKPLPDNLSYEYFMVTVEPITEEEYNILYDSIAHNEEIYNGKEPEPEIPPVPDTPNTTTIEFVRLSKINEINYQCQQTIIAGFDLEICGGTHHFSLTTQDQLNLMNLGVMAQTENMIPYHADGEEVSFYTAEEINELIAAANNFKIYQTTYCNALKTYINTLETIEEISAITYGDEIPEEYKSSVLKTLE